jgi:hypothetical protein
MRSTVGRVAEDAGLVVSSEAGPGPITQDPWFNPNGRPVRFFIAEAGVDTTAGAAVVACVVADDVDILERQWHSAIESMLEDPQLRAVPNSLNAIRRRLFEYRAVDTELRARIARTLASLAFEAYVSFTMSSADRLAMYEQLVRGIVFDRLRAYRTREVEIGLWIEDSLRRTVASSVIEASAADVRLRHPTARQAPPRILGVDTNSVGAMVAEDAAEIVRERVDHGGAARTFNLIYPNKLRVLFDADARRYYTRSNPYPG